VVIDVSHRIDPFNIVEAALMVCAVFRYFPAGTVHMVVVDPGVGSERRIIAVDGDGYRWIAPDNGVLYPLIAQLKTVSMVAVVESRYFRTTVSNTFHGRDIMAPVAGHLSKGLPLDRLGPPVTADTLVRCELSAPVITAEGLQGQVMTIDRFGNLITNIDQTTLLRIMPRDQWPQLRIHVGQHTINGLVGRYCDVASRQPLALIGSREVLEVAVNAGNAERSLGAGPGDPVVVTGPPV
jgi:S-adenosylmethionine hydrolase